MAHGFVQEDAGPARAQHHCHFASRGGAGFQVGQGSVHRLVHILAQLCVIEIRQTKAATTAGRAHFAAAVLLGNHGDRQAHQRAHIGGQRAVGTGHQHHVVFTGQARHHLRHAGVLGAGALLQALQQGHLGGAVQRSNGVYTLVKAAAGGNLFGGYAHTASLRHGRNGTHGARGIQQRGQRNVIRIRKSGLFAAHGAHAHALVNAERAGLHNALFQAPALAARVLEVQIGIVHLVGTDFRQRTGQVALVQPKRRQQQFTGDINALGGGCALRRCGRGAKGHRRILGGQPHPHRRRGKLRYALCEAERSTSTATGAWCCTASMPASRALAPEYIWLWPMTWPLPAFKVK